MHIPLLAGKIIDYTLDLDLIHNKIKIILRLQISLNFSNFRRNKKEFCRERLHRLIIPGLFSMCFTNAIVTYFEFCMREGTIGTFYHLLTKGFMATYKENFYSFLISEPHLLHIPRTATRQIWFLFYLFGYSILLLPVFYRYHKKCSIDNELVSNGSRFTLRFSKCIWINHLCPKNKDEFASFVTNVMKGRMKLLLYPGVMLCAINFFLLNSLWLRHTRNIFVYFLGYAFMSADPADIDKKVTKNGISFLIIGTLFLLLRDRPEISLPTVPTIEMMIKIALLGFGQWMFILGTYGTVKKLYKRDSKMITFLRPLQMPFYLLHVVVLRGNTFLGIAIGLHGLGLLCFRVFSTTLVTGLLSYITTKSPNVIKYLFGIATLDSNDSSRSWLKEYGILAFLLLIRVVGYIMLNFTDIIKVI